MQISIFWILIGILLIFFGIGLKMAFSENRRSANLASWLIILYGFGEGIGSGVFKDDHHADGLATSGIIHEVFGSIGAISILLFPLVMLKIIPKNKNGSITDSVGNQI